MIIKREEKKEEKKNIAQLLFSNNEEDRGGIIEAIEEESLRAQIKMPTEVKKMLEEADLSLIQLLLFGMLKQDIKILTVAQEEIMKSLLLKATKATQAS